ncbi:APC family permease [Alicyclobacillus mali]|uniref:APC family permease n=1 Tax=Alicyclobacillus mali (ex Roth et al. 2021) TaxID=1123961 RepID=A0ABS0F3Y0_9BACL|nr:APC family permease [Alicyclobacillus mali (ex Roth et al. 2021)]MBF8378025.1 APC family permease [Alicyclobacillus mali (ex Roth et al. 2021)]
MDKGMRREIQLVALTMTGLGSIIGSGWLFGAWKAAKVAGPAAMVAWILGMAVILLIGLTYAELGPMFPRSGGMVRYAHYSHGSFVGFLSGWANWIAIASVIPIEAEASIQYMSSWPWHWAQWTHHLYVNKTLTPPGLLLAAILVFIYFLLNYWTVKLFARANTLITVFKFIIPTLTVIGLIAAHFDTHNFTQYGGFAPNGWASVLTAIATSGVIFAFNGFQSPINLAGEARNPSRNVPLAVIGSVLLAGVIYLCLQAAFIGSMPGSLLSHGWASINLKSPFADLALALNVNWLAIVLFLDAFVSPSGTGITYTATTARMVHGMEANGYFPKVFGRIHPRYGVPRAAMWLNLVIAYIFMLMFRGWGELSGVISVATLISYVTGPIAVMAFRNMGDHVKRPVRVPGMTVIAPIAFIFASLILYWAQWPLTGEVIIVIIIGLPVYFYYMAKAGWRGFAEHFRHGLWLMVYLLWMALISFLGSGKFGGIGVLPYGWDMVVVAASALVFYLWGVRSGFSKPNFPEGENPQLADAE